MFESGLDNELLTLDTGFENSAMAAEERESGPAYGEYGDRLNWQDSYGPAKKRLGVTEKQWAAFIAGVNDIKQRAYEANIGNPFTGKGGKYGPRVEGTGGPGQINPEYEALMNELNALYETVGFGPKAGIIGDGERGNLRFDFYTGDMVYETGDLIHQFGKGLVKAVGGAMFGAGFSSFLSSSFGLSSMVSNSISNFVVSTVTGSGGDIGLEDALFMALGPAGEFADEVNDTGQAIIDAIKDYVTDSDNYDNDNEIVWGEIDYEGIEGEFDPDAPDNPYDPGLIDPQLPQYPEDEVGGEESPDDAVADPSNDGAPSENEGQYEVTEKTDDGIVVTDRTDGDIWIIQGDYEIGDIVPEDEMIDATGGGVDPQNDGANTEDASPQDGDPCFMEDGTPGVMRDGVCSLPSATITVNPDVWGNDTDGDGQVDSELDNTEDTPTTTTDIATPDPEVVTDNDGVSPGVLVVADDVWGTDTSGDGNAGTGNGDSNGDGDGDGNDGDDGNKGNSAGKTVSRGSSKTQWSPLYPDTKFRRFDKRARQGMMSQISQPNFSQDSRQNLYAGMFSDLMKGKA